MFARALSQVRKQLGQVLIDQGKLSQAQLQEGLTLQRQGTGMRLGEALCQLGYADAQTIHEALVVQAGVSTVDPDKLKIAPEALAAIPAELAFRHKVLPISIHDGSLTVAMADPLDRAGSESLRLFSGRRIQRHYCEEARLMEAIRKLYGSNVARMIADLDSDVQTPGEGGAESESTNQLQEMAREPSIVNLVNLVILEAIEAHASDIHIEPFEKIMKVKYRIDGVLHEVSPPSKRLQPAIVSRIKIMAGMNIAERFVPQDGHITFAGPRGKIDIRVGTVPTVFGECIAMRLLDRSAALIKLEGLGLKEECLAGFSNLLVRPHGIVLVTGPTGSGKTTTLYAALHRLYTPEKKIITIEDPVEYQLEGVNQIPVNRKRGVDFAGGLRAILRQDPDIIMVGEIRDRETADIAIRSALTGHLVFSTLHTNDACGAVLRLIDMGVEPYLLASSLEGVLAQRLVRTICPHCKFSYRPELEVLERISRNGSRHGDFFRGQGCRQCRQTGYSGRVGIFEFLTVTQAVRQAIVRRATSEEIASVAPPEHEPMRADGFRKAQQGTTTLEEVFRVTQDTQDE